MLQNKKLTTIYVPFEDNKKVKKLGARWNQLDHIWECQTIYKANFLEWLEPQKKYYIYSVFSDKENVKKLGGQWDRDVRAWYGLDCHTELLKKYKRKKV